MAPVRSSRKAALAAGIAVTLTACDGDSLSLGLPETVNDPVTAESSDILLEDDITQNTAGAQNCSPLLGAGSVGDVAGLWDTTDVSEGLRNVALTRISDNGEITFFDFQQDDVGNGENCYVIVSGASVIEQVSESTFINTFYSDPDTSCNLLIDEIEVTVNPDGDLDIISIDQFDEDNDGNTNETITETFPEIFGVSTTDLIACDP